MTSRTRRRLKDWSAGYLFILPAFTLFVLFMLYPSIQGVRLSFFRLTGFQEQFIGFGNYEYLFVGETYSETFWTATLNTLRYVVLIVPLVMVLSFLVSIAIYNLKPWLTSFFRAGFYVPTIASSVVVSVVWGWMLNPDIGLINYILEKLGLPRSVWLANPNIALYVVVFIILTWALGRPIILYTAAMGFIPTEYYEVADIEGASNAQKVWHITMPLVKPTTLFNLVLTTINGFQTFAIIMLLTKGGPYGTTTSIIFELYQNAFVYMDHGVAAAMGTLLFFVIGIVAFFQFRLLTTEVEY
jgi:multiple sugar transport system permease protein